MPLCNSLGVYRARWMIQLKSPITLQESLHQFCVLIDDEINNHREEPTEHETYFVVEVDEPVNIDARFTVFRVSDLHEILALDSEKGLTDEELARSLQEYHMPGPAQMVEEGSSSPGEVEDKLLSLPIGSKVLVVVDNNELECLLVSGHLGPGDPQRPDVVDTLYPRGGQVQRSCTGPHMHSGTYSVTQFPNKRRPIRCHHWSGSQKCNVYLV